MGHKSLAHVQRGTEHRWFLSVDWSDRVLLPQISSYHIFHFVIYFQFSPLLRADSLYRQFADNASFALSSFRRLLRFILNNFSIFQLYSCVADGYLQFRNFLWIGVISSNERSGSESNKRNKHATPHKRSDRKGKTLWKFDGLMLTLSHNRQQKQHKETNVRWHEFLFRFCTAKDLIFFGSSLSLLVESVLFCLLPFIDMIKYTLSFFVPELAVDGNEKCACFDSSIRFSNFVSLPFLEASSGSFRL